MTLPVFRSGLKRDLTLLEFLVNHTIWGEEPQFIPKEQYLDIFRDRAEAQAEE